MATTKTLATEHALLPLEEQGWFIKAEAEAKALSCPFQDVRDVHARIDRMQQDAGTYDPHNLVDVTLDFEYTDE